MRRLALAWLFASGAWAHAAPLPGVVVVVIDGDTVLFRPDPAAASTRAFFKLRLADIDAPEAGQAHGTAATRALEAIALGRRGEVEIVATDRYGRRVGRLAVGDTAVNAALVRHGHAWASPYRRQAELRVLEDAARAARRGLWRDPAPTPPWVWRRAGPVRGR